MRRTEGEKTAQGISRFRVGVTTNLKGGFLTRPCKQYRRYTNGIFRAWGVGFGFLLIKLSEAVLELDQEGSDGDIRESELVAKEVPSFPDWRETILGYVESLEDSVV